MSELLLWPSGTQVQHFFWVFDEDDAPVEGEVNGDFAKVLVHDGAAPASGVVVVVSEVDDALCPGLYKAVFTPPSGADGYWVMRVSHATYMPRGVFLNVLCDPSAVYNQLADHVLRRHSANAAAAVGPDSEDFQSLLGATRTRTCKQDTVATPGSLLTYKEDGTTVAGTQALTTDAGADPIVTVGNG